MALSASACFSSMSTLPLIHQPRENHPVREKRNPHLRLTTPEDVARCIVAICHPVTYWTTGNTLHVDGGESIIG